MVYDTRERIRQAAIALFTSQHYENVSIVSICRTVGIANSAFYYYYKNKEELFKEILYELFNYLDAAHGKNSGDTANERLRAMLDVHIEASRKFSKQLIMYREGEYLYPEFDYALKAIYHSTLEIVFQRRVSLAEYYFFIGGLRFVSIRFRSEELLDCKDQLVNIITQGLSVKNSLEEASATTAYLRTLLDREVSLALPEKPAAKRKLMLAGIDLFGEKGFEKTQVSEICASCGYSVGMFYKNFRTKRDFLAEMITIFSGAMETVLQGNTMPALSGTRTAAEDLLASFELFTATPKLYAILRETEFSAPDLYRAFFDRLELVYLGGEGMRFADSPAITVNFLLGISYYLAGEVLFSKEVPDHVAVIPEVRELLVYGMRSNHE